MRGIGAMPFIPDPSLPEFSDGESACGRGIALISAGCVCRR